MEQKQRHGCLTAWLILMMIGNAISTLAYLVLDPKALENQGVTMTKEQMIILAFLGILNLSFAIGLWFWKKWAFYGFAISGFLMFLTNLNLGVDIISSAFGLVGVMLLYTILQMKTNDKSGWDNLE